MGQLDESIRQVFASVESLDDFQAEMADADDCEPQPSWQELGVERDVEDALRAISEARAAARDCSERSRSLSPRLAAYYERRARLLEDVGNRLGWALDVDGPAEPALYADEATTLGAPAPRRVYGEQHLARQPSAPPLAPRPCGSRPRARRRRERRAGRASPKSGESDPEPSPGRSPVAREVGP